MKNFRIVSSYVFTLIIVETLLQIIFYSIQVEYFDRYSINETFGKIVFDAFYVIGTVKAVFFLPLYFVFYFFVSQTPELLTRIWGELVQLGKIMKIKNSQNQ